MKDVEEEIVDAFDQLILTESHDQSNMDAAALEQVPIVQGLFFPQFVIINQ